MGGILVFKHPQNSDILFIKYGDMYDKCLKSPGFTVGQLVLMVLLMTDLKVHLSRVQDQRLASVVAVFG